MNFESLHPGTHFTAGFAQAGGLRVELYIDTGDVDETLAIFQALHDRHDEIEAAFGNRLDWQEISEKRVCRIVSRRVSGDLSAASRRCDPESCRIAPIAGPGMHRGRPPTSRR